MPAANIGLRRGLQPKPKKSHSDNMPRASEISDLPPSFESVESKRAIIRNSTPVQPKDDAYLDPQEDAFVQIDLEPDTPSEEAALNGLISDGSEAGAQVDVEGACPASAELESEKSSHMEMVVAVQPSPKQGTFSKLNLEKPDLYLNHLKRVLPTFQLSDLPEVGELGAGAFGHVVKVQLPWGPDGIPRFGALKLRMGKKTPEEIEAAVACEVHGHRVCAAAGTVPLLGLVLSGERAVGVLTEPCDSDMGTFFSGKTKPDDVTMVSTCRLLAERIDALHAEGVAHMDLKLGNVLYKRTPAGPIFYIGDLDGVAKLEPDGGLPQTSSAWPGCMRTLSHTGPEDMCTLARNPRAGDVYAFGCMLLELQGPHIKSGWTQTCFEMAIDAGTFYPRLSRFGLLAPGLRRLVIDCLRPDPADRPVVADVIRRLADLERSLRQASPEQLKAALDSEAAALAMQEKAELAQAEVDRLQALAYDLVEEAEEAAESFHLDDGDLLLPAFFMADRMAADEALVAERLEEADMATLQEAEAAGVEREFSLGAKLGAAWKAWEERAVAVAEDAAASGAGVDARRITAVHAPDGGVAPCPSVAASPKVAASITTPRAPVPVAADVPAAADFIAARCTLLSEPAAPGTAGPHPTARCFNAATKRQALAERHFTNERAVLLGGDKRHTTVVWGRATTAPKRRQPDSFPSLPPGRGRRLLGRCAVWASMPLPAADAQRQAP
ncbi:hypothetical protein APUTEX25_000655 [Auxenochlorella protothecoides]|uniref:Protein kinase domain-containing protein n=1 Tax=Auxenochlorella protothecoides TaxID=3075 RepID=A0A3M7KRE9_AUXPR|nr:hypothetical protein APUTEX25_000655 [Auxenochlorella protothecoides]|eukprot:RMZ52380.1 hypothetical protein APUTEX25_000655 [Auxenochlorella protothecoides]